MYARPDNLAVPHGRMIIPFSFQVALASITGAGDVITGITMPFSGSIYDSFFVVNVAVTTGAKAVTLNWEVGTRNIGVGTIALTSANCTPMGAIIAAAAITGSEGFIRGDWISLEAASVTAFAEGSGTVVLLVQTTVP